MYSQWPRWNRISEHGHSEQPEQGRYRPSSVPLTHAYNEHDDVIKRIHFPRYWPFVRGIYRSPVNSSHKGQWRRALVFSLICTWINDWVNSREAGDLRRHRAHYDVTVMKFWWNSISSSARHPEAPPVVQQARLRWRQDDTLPKKWFSTGIIL